MAERRLDFVVGARPNFVKAAPVLRAARRDGGFSCRLIHTGQHYDRELSEVFFRDLELPEPDISLAVGSGSHAVQTARTMEAIEGVLESRRPDLVIVFGDVNATLAAALTAAKLAIPVAHVEAGLRSFDPAMPEEINRRVTDCVSDLLFTTEESADDNLRREGVPGERIHRVGNTMVDSLLRFLEPARSRRAGLTARLGLAAERYAVLTLHRPSNVDDPEMLERLLTTLAALPLPIVFPAHPRTRRRLAADPALESAVTANGRLRLSAPLAYLDFLSLVDGSSLVLTDSGGVQEETTALGVPCLTLRETTERPVTVEEGTNEIVGRDPEAIRAGAARALARPRSDSPTRPRGWDGKAAERIVAALRAHFAAGGRGSGGG